MEPKRPESFGERTVDDVERGAARVRRTADDAGRTLDRDAHTAGRDAAAGVRDVGRGAEGVGDRVGRAVGDVGDAARTSIDAVGDAAHETLAPGESVTLVPPGETEVVDVTGGARSPGQVEIGSAPFATGAGLAAGAGAAPAAGAQGRDWLSMSTDNTSAGSTEGIGNTGPIDLAVRGMRVVDANGDEIGKVDDIKMGDPAAATTQGEVYDDGGLLDDIGRAVFGGSALPEQIRDNLLRIGYLRVDGKGWFDTDYFVAANQVARVEGDTVHLSVAKEELPTT